VKQWRYASSSNYFVSIEVILQTVKWDPEKITADTAQEPNNYMRDLVKETVKLYRILRRYLFPASVNGIFKEIFPMYAKRLEQEFSRIDLYTISGKTQMLADVQFYIVNLSALEHVEGPGTQLEVVVNNLRIRERPPAQLSRQAPPARPFASPLMPTANSSAASSSAANAAKQNVELPLAPVASAQQPSVGSSSASQLQSSVRVPPANIGGTLTNEPANLAAATSTISQQKPSDTPLAPESSTKPPPIGTTMPAVSAAPAAQPGSQPQQQKLPAPTASATSAAQNQQPIKQSQPQPTATATESTAKKLGSAFSVGLGNFGKYMSAKTAELTQKAASAAAATTAVSAAQQPQPPVQKSMPTNSQSASALQQHQSPALATPVKPQEQQQQPATGAPNATGNSSSANNDDDK
jgi:hypothetical protein